MIPSRSTREDVPWQSESKYIVPQSEKDSLPHASEGARHSVPNKMISVWHFCRNILISIGTTNNHNEMCNNIQIAVKNAHYYILYKNGGYRMIMIPTLNLLRPKNKPLDFHQVSFRCAGKCTVFSWECPTWTSTSWNSRGTHCPSQWNIAGCEPYPLWLSPWKNVLGFGGRFLRTPFGSRACPLQLGGLLRITAVDPWPWTFWRTDFLKCWFLDVFGIWQLISTSVQHKDT